MVTPWREKLPIGSLTVESRCGQRDFGLMARIASRCSGVAGPGRSTSWKGSSTESQQRTSPRPTSSVSARWKRYQAAFRDITTWDLRDGLFRFRIGVRAQLDAARGERDAAIEEAVAETVGNPTFSGTFLEVGGFLTGQHRAYDLAAGAFDRVTPNTTYRGGNPFRRKNGAARRARGHRAVLDHRFDRRRDRGLRDARRQRRPRLVSQRRNAIDAELGAL
jgi:hypothetical protein